MRLEIGAICALEDRTGILFDALTVRVRKGRISELRALLWAALQAAHAPEFPTPEHVTVIVDAIGVRQLRAILATFLQLNADDVVTPEKGARPAPPDTRPGSSWRRLYLDAAIGDRFWTLSLRELWLELATRRQQQQTDRDRIRVQAWYTSAAIWHGFAGTLGSLQKWLGVKQQEQTGPQQIAMLQHLSEYYGLPLRITPAAKGN